MLALIPFTRFVIAYLSGDGAGHVQSLIFGAVLFNAAVVLVALGIIGDLLYAQRIMTQRIFERVRRIELQLDVPPSHYEPGRAPDRPAADDRRARRPEDRGTRGAAGMSTTKTTVSAEGIVTGNTYDKYGSTNPVVKRLMADFEATLDELFEKADPAVAARRRLRRGRARARVGPEAGRQARRRHRPRGGVDPGGLGASARRRTSSTRS